MDQDDQGNKRRALEIYPPKRRPGRPRKQPRTNADREENVVPRFQNLQRQENAPILPGFAGVNGNQPRQGNANDIVVGQSVHGVIDSTFNGGYLLTVRVGNSDNTLRGVVFKSGQDVPIALNNGSMIRRNEIVPIPADHLNQVQVHNPQSRERNEQHVNSYRTPVPKLPISRAKHPPLVRRAGLPILKIRQHPPVPILPKNNVLNVVPPLPVEASKGKHTDQINTVGDQVLPSPPTSNPQGMPSENLPTEDPSKSEKTQMIAIKKENNDIDDQPILVEPLQSILPDLNNPASPLEPFEDF